MIGAHRLTPRVSVLLPVRDAEATLACALASVARQSEARFECVIVDDGSRDESREIAQRFAARDARFRVIAAPREGLVAALNRGIAECGAPLVARFDADDVMRRTRLAKQCDALDADPALAGVGCHVHLFPQRAISEGLRDYGAWLNSLASAADIARDAFVECPLAHPTLVLRRELLRSLGYRERGWPEDYDLVLRVLASGRALGVVPEKLLAWRDGPARLSRTSPAYAQAAFTACKAEYLAQGFLAAHERYALWGYGGTGRALAKALAARGKQLGRVIELHPRRLGQRIHGAEVVPPAALRERSALPLLVSVAGSKPRAEIRAELAALGYEERRDFVCAA
ncbi:MAG: glycosyltransferase [Deltaproteobacteria bacterium]|nr:glycosyltransferase [Deltaproteobacteria bacterium]